MPVIGPPKDDYLNEIGKPPVSDCTAARYDWVRWFMDCKSWKCKCGLTNFGRNKACAWDKCRKPRPIEYVENVYEGYSD